MDKFKMLPEFKVNFIVKAMSETMSYGIKLHNIPEMWKSTKGEGVKVGIIDTGLPVHNDLKNQIDESANFTSDPIADLVVGHGTHTAGIVSAEENGEGVVGIAPKSRLYIAKGLDDQGSGTDESLAKAVDWCVEKEVDIISMSLGAPGIYEKFFPKTKEAIQKAYKKNITIICAAGNEDASMVGFPASMPETISVAAINSEKQRANFSNKGSRNDFAAAGVDVISTYINNNFASLSGTSMACPAVAGIAALVISYHKKGLGADDPIKTPEDVREHIRKICVDLGQTGKDVEYGNGMPVFGHMNVTPIVKKTWYEMLWERIYGLWH